MERKIRVRLLVDLPRYHPGLRTHVEGHTIGQSGLWSRASDRFVGVYFPGIGSFDILWESLEIVDEDYLRESAAREARKWESLRTASSVVKRIGPKGGFKSLSYQYVLDEVNIHESTGSKSEAERLSDFFEKNGIAINIRTISNT